MVAVDACSWDRREKEGKDRRCLWLGQEGTRGKGQDTPVAGTGGRKRERTGDACGWDRREKEGKDSKKSGVKQSEARICFLTARGATFKKGKRHEVVEP